MMTVIEVLLRYLPDKQYVQLQYFKHFKRLPNLLSPQTFNEKLQWLKLYDRRPEYTVMVDKYLVKDYVREKIGDHYIIPTIVAFDHAYEVDFKILPDKFVLKWNHDSGSVVVCKDKSKFDKESAIKQLSAAENGSKGYWYGREWPYKNVRPKLIAEQLLESDGDLVDYKLMCFNGKVKCIFTCTRRFSKEGLRVTFYDLDWNIMPFTRNHPREESPMTKPISLESMVSAAENLTKNIPFARIDFYEVDGRPYFGEITLYPGSGLEPFDPEEWDYTLGDWLKLPFEK